MDYLNENINGLDISAAGEIIAGAIDADAIFYADEYTEESYEADLKSDLEEHGVAIAQVLSVALYTFAEKYHLSEDEFTNLLSGIIVGLREANEYSSNEPHLESIEESTDEPVGDIENTEPSEYFLLGYWINPYGRNDREYYWMRDFETRKEALEAGKRKQKNGQPKEFIDWCEGRNQVFSSAETFLKAAKKAGLNPRMD